MEGVWLLLEELRVMELYRTSARKLRYISARTCNWDRRYRLDVDKG